MLLFYKPNKWGYWLFVEKSQAAALLRKNLSEWSIWMHVLQILISIWIIGFGFFVWFCFVYAKAWGSHKFSIRERLVLTTIPALAMLVPLVLPAVLPAFILENAWLLGALMIFSTIVVQFVTYSTYLLLRLRS
jgi:hypothetical protein